jgi:general secretion pathway protein G
MLTRNPHRAARRRSAFTLMEVLLVVAILLILGSILVVSFSGIMGGAEEDTTKTLLKEVASQVNYYKLACRQPPTTLNDLLNAPPGMETKWRGPYLKDVPRDAWNQEITFADNGDGTFTVSSPGPPNQNKPIIITERYSI